VETRRKPRQRRRCGGHRKLHLLARRLILPHPGGGTLDVTAPLPVHMRRAFDMFGFDVKRYDPIENAPE
jgi:23S rRNA pseudouridine955/2504/2580 synthase